MRQMTKQGLRSRAKRDAGQCQVCGDPQAKDSMSLCERHLFMQRLRQRALIARRRMSNVSGPLPEVSPSLMSKALAMVKDGESARRIKEMLGVPVIAVDAAIVQFFEEQKKNGDEH